jgi:hypothetical protein
VAGLEESNSRQGEYSSGRWAGYGFAAQRVVRILVLGSLSYRREEEDRIDFYVAVLKHRIILRVTFWQIGYDILTSAGHGKLERPYSTLHAGGSIPEIHHDPTPRAGATTPCPNSFIQAQLPGASPARTARVRIVADEELWDRLRGIAERDGDGKGFIGGG